jgi:Kef-type K+ transport system membrane component KefB
MFVVGLEVDLRQILKQQISVVLTNNFSVLVPLCLRVAFPKGSSIPNWLLSACGSCRLAFHWTAMRTALPVLARILQERGLLPTELGRMAISCAAVDDVTAWILLALLTAMVQSAAD